MNYEPTFECLDCLDEPNAWAPSWCPGSGERRVQADAKPERSARAPIGYCGRTFDHGPHDWVHRCHCWQTNRTVKARKERQAGHAA